VDALAVLAIIARDPGHGVGTEKPLPDLTSEGALLPRGSGGPGRDRTGDIRVMSSPL
jgi:hypothetical protein